MGDRNENGDGMGAVGRVMGWWFRGKEGLALGWEDRFSSQPLLGWCIQCETVDSKRDGTFSESAR